MCVCVIVGLSHGRRVVMAKFNAKLSNKRVLSVQCSLFSVHLPEIIIIISHCVLSIFFAIFMVHIRCAFLPLEFILQFL